MGLRLSNCHIVGNHMSWHNYYDETNQSGHMTHIVRAKDNLKLSHGGLYAFSCVSIL